MGRVREEVLMDEGGPPSKDSVLRDRRLHMKTEA